MLVVHRVWNWSRHTHRTVVLVSNRAARPRRESLRTKEGHGRDDAGPSSTSSIPLRSYWSRSTLAAERLWDTVGLGRSRNMVYISTTHGGRQRGGKSNITTERRNDSHFSFPQSIFIAAMETFFWTLRFSRFWDEQRFKHWVYEMK